MKHAKASLVKMLLAMTTLSISGHAAAQADFASICEDFRTHPGVYLVKGDGKRQRLIGLWNDGGTYSNDNRLLIVLSKGDGTSEAAQHLSVLTTGVVSSDNTKKLRNLITSRNKVNSECETKGQYVADNEFGKILPSEEYDRHRSKDHRNGPPQELLDWHFAWNTSPTKGDISGCVETKDHIPAYSVRRHEIGKGAIASLVTTAPAFAVDEPPPNTMPAKVGTMVLVHRTRDDGACHVMLFPPANNWTPDRTVIDSTLLRNPKMFPFFSRRVITWKSNGS